MVIAETLVSAIMVVKASHLLLESNNSRSMEHLSLDFRRPKFYLVYRSPYFGPPFCSTPEFESVWWWSPVLSPSNPRRGGLCVDRVKWSYSLPSCADCFPPMGLFSPRLYLGKLAISSLLLWYPERPPMEMLHQCQDQITNDHTDFFHANKPVMNLFNP